MKFLNALNAINTSIDSVVKWLIILLMILIPVIMVLQVVIRYVFNYPLSWHEELTRIAFVWLVFMTACAALRRDEVVSMNYLVDRLNYKIARVLKIVAHILVLIFLVVAFYSGVDMTSFVFQRGTPTPALEIPVWISYISLPIGCILMGFQILSNLLQIIFAPSNGSVVNSEKHTNIGV